jgi:acyl transferase domain-containing protein
MDRVLQALPEPPNWFITDEIMKSTQTSNLHNASYSQPISTAIQVGLVDVLRELNLSPGAVIGHSSGEIAAAYAARCITAHEAILLAFYRGIACEKPVRSGAMAAIGMGRKETEPFLVPGVVIACENSPLSVTISGPDLEIHKVMQAIHNSHSSVFIRKLKVNMAYHSPLMVQLGQRYRSLIDDVFKGSYDAKSGASQFVSCVTGGYLSVNAVRSPEYWQRNLELPVIFYNAAQTVLADSGSSLFLEVGPHSALSGPIRQIMELAFLTYPYVSCLVRGVNCAESLLLALGQLYTHGLPLNLSVLINPTHAVKVLTDLPTYPWDHTYSNLFSTRLVDGWLHMEYPKHELLGVRVSESTDNEPSWRNVLPVDQLLWLRDHKVENNVVFPAAGYVSMAGEAVRQLNRKENAGFCIRNMAVTNALFLSDRDSVEILTSLRRWGDRAWYDLAISSHNGLAWVQHCTGTIHSIENVPRPSTIALEDLPRSVNVPRWYKALERAGYGYGTNFQGMKDVYSSTTEHRATGTIVPILQDSSYTHASTLDAFFQTIFVAVNKGRIWRLNNLLVPVHFAKIEVYKHNSLLQARTSAEILSNGSVHGFGEAFDSSGNLAMKVYKAKLHPLSGEGRSDSSQVHYNASRLHWAPDIAFQDLNNLVKSPPVWDEHTKLLTRLTTLCVGQACSKLEGIKPVAAHLCNYKKWLMKQPQETSDYELKSLVEHLLSSPAAPCANAMVKVLDNLVPIFRGEVEPLEVLMSEHVLFQLYNYLNECNRDPLFQLLGHNDPKQRVLEIGAGTGGSTVKILSQMQCSTYTFTDVSSAFFPAAKERFASYNNIVYKTLDVTKDPCEQGFEAESFDLILAANVLHATSSLHDTLTNVRKLLHPEGKLLLEELCPPKFHYWYPSWVVGWCGGW